MNRYDSFNSLVAIYDFELFPFALGDVLTWNVRTAMRCTDLGREKVDIYLCADDKYPAWVHQREMVNAQNFDLFFTELYTAFGTHPKLGNIFIYRSRDELIDRLRQINADDPGNSEAINDYLQILKYREVHSVPSRVKRRILNHMRRVPGLRRFVRDKIPGVVKRAVHSAILPNDEVINNYLIKYISSHAAINAYADKHKGVPFLNAAKGCLPDVEELIGSRLAGKKIVPFHLRLRRLDAGYGGSHSYARDSDFLQWYEFLREAGRLYPDVQFIALGRMQEKPLELLALPNVTSLRALGLGLGHELTLMMHSDLFIGSSSGFAAMANFSTVPYFITKMHAGACSNYAIAEGEKRLPFAKSNQVLVYGEETSELLLSLLAAHFGDPRAQAPDVQEVAREAVLDVSGWLNERLRLKNSAVTTNRFFVTEKYRDEETSFLLLLSLEAIRQKVLEESIGEAKTILAKIARNFPRLCEKLAEYQAMEALVGLAEVDLQQARRKAESTNFQVSGFFGVAGAVPAHGLASWRPNGWIISGRSRPLDEEPCSSMSIKYENPGSNWATLGFIADNPSGKIIVCFEARRSQSSALYLMHVFEDGIHRPAGEFCVDEEWRTFRIPVVTIPGARLSLQVDLADDTEWICVRDFHVAGATTSPRKVSEEFDMPVDQWSGEPGAVLTDDKGLAYREWHVDGRRGFVQTPEFRDPTGAGIIFSFEVKTDCLAQAFTPAYVFDGPRYKKQAEYAFSADWTRVEIELCPDADSPSKVQLDYPEGVGVLSIRKCRVAYLMRDDPDGAREDVRPEKAALCD